MTLGIDAFPEAGIRALSHPGHAFTLMSSGRVIGCSGVMQLFPGVGEATAFLTPELREKFPVSLHKAAVRGLEQIRSNYNYHRIQMHVAPDFKAGCEWARRLGFKWEGVMPMCTPDKRTLIRFGQTWS
jgi:hypothetical protein